MPMSNKNDRPYVELEGTSLVYPNLSGLEDDYNPAGHRHTGVAIPDPKLAEQMREDGWNIKMLQNGDDDPIYWTDLVCNYRTSRVKPRIYSVNPMTNVATLLDAESVGSLDGAEILSVDVAFSGNPNKNQNAVYKYKGYIDEMYCVVKPSRFASKYVIAGINSAPEEEVPFE